MNFFKRRSNSATTSWVICALSNVKLETVERIAKVLSVQAYDLIRKLLKAGMSYRKIAEAVRCCHGSASAEGVPMRCEDEVLKKKLAAQVEAERQLQLQEELIEKINLKLKYIRRWVVSFG